jgi:hypothetical protein
MPTYRVSQKIRTVAALAEPKTVESFTLDPYAPSSPTVGAWLATEETRASDVCVAVNGSRQKLLPVIDALASMLQCSFSLTGTAFMAYRLEDNPECIIYFRLLRSKPTTGMMLWGAEQLQDVKKLLQGENTAVLRYFREAINAATSSAGLAMLVVAAEGLAGSDNNHG